MKTCFEAIRKPLPPINLLLGVSHFRVSRALSREKNTGQNLTNCTGEYRNSVPAKVQIRTMNNQTLV